MASVGKRTSLGEDGFSLVELMVVVMIVAVLLAIAVPTFLGMRRRGQDVKAQSLLTAAAKVEAGEATDADEFTDDLGLLALDEPAIDWSGLTDESVHVTVAEVTVGSGLDEQVLLYARSSSDEWFGIRLVAVGASAGRHTCSGTAESDVNVIASCTGSNW